MTIGKVYGDPPFRYSTDYMIRVAFETDAATVQELLPPVLKTPEQAIGTLMVVRHRYSPFGPYTGVYLGVVASLDGEPVGFGLSGLKDTFSGVAAGRELWGMPLQIGAVEAGWQENVFTVDARRANALPIVSMSVQLTDRRSTEFPAGTGAFAPEAPGFEGHDQNLLVGVDMTIDYTRAEAWSAMASLKFHAGTPLDDWSRIPVGRLLDCSFVTDVTMDLPRGNVLARW